MRGRAMLGVGIVAAACGGGPRAEPRNAPPSARAAEGTRALLFRAPGFPTIDAPALDDAVLDSAIAGIALDQARSVADLGKRLEHRDVRTLVLAHGSAFPVDAWPAIRTFLRGGGGLVVLGGAPFHEPVRADGGSWVRGPRTTTFAHDLLVGPAEEIATPDGARASLLGGWTSPLPLPTKTWALTLRLATKKDFPEEHGSDGPPDAFARPLVHVLDARGTPRACPLLEIDRASGARWIFAASDAKLDAPAVRAIVTRALAGAAKPEPPARTLARDEGLLHTGPKITASRDFLRKDGKVFPVVGTTYMASDVHRRFLFEPNPALWDADFAAMKRHGIGFVRTGLWTAWSRVIPDGKAVDRGVLDALEAYVQTAAKHGIVVCFNFFAFLPPDFGGTHAYLDPRALAGQRALLEAVGKRFRGVPWVHWDLINEPSYSPKDKLWKTRPVRDEHEKRAWRAWVEKRHGKDEAKLRALWRSPEDDLYAPPRDDEFAQAFVQVDKRPRKVRDFVEFTQDVVTEWARTMRSVLRLAAGEDALVTLGQDEGGIYERPTQQLMADALDYTAIHTWWNNDDLLWDGVLTKVAHKASLHQETGLMRLEDGDGTPWRTPDVAARLLERKLAYAFMARGAGVVQWAWNVNPTMPIDEESTIGLFRPDGTAKPELDVLARFAAFAQQAAPHLDDFEPDPVVLVVPHARAFLGRKNALDATKIVVRALAERFGVVPTAVSDLRLDAGRLRGAKLVLVPAPDVIDEPAMNALLAATRAGTKVLITGAIEGDSYGIFSAAHAGLDRSSRPVAMQERTGWSATGLVAFEGMAQESVRRATGISTGKLTGNLWHEPLPLELAREREPLVRLLDVALRAANVPISLDGAWGVSARVLSAPQVALVVVANERPEAAKRSVVVDGRPLEIDVAALGARLLLVARAKGNVIAETPLR
jgi:hypothetical protein